MCRQVRRARDNLRYIGERVTKGMDEVDAYTPRRVPHNNKFDRFSFPDQGGYREGTSSHRSVDDAEFKIGDGVTTIREPRGERDRGIRLDVEDR